MLYAHCLCCLPPALPRAYMTSSITAVVCCVFTPPWACSCSEQMPCCNRQRKYAEVPAPPVAQMAPRIRREERSGLRPLATAADADKIFAAYDEAETDLNRDWVTKKK